MALLLLLLLKKALFFPFKISNLIFALTSSQFFINALHAPERKPWSEARQSIGKVSSAQSITYKYG